jgi:hypothetical protein
LNSYNRKFLKKESVDISSNSEFISEAKRGETGELYFDPHEIKMKNPVHRTGFSGAILINGFNPFFSFFRFRKHIFGCPTDWAGPTVRNLLERRPALYSSIGITLLRVIDVTTDLTLVFDGT